MVKSENDVSYSLLLFGLAAVAWSLSKLATIETGIAMALSVIITVLASSVAVAGLVHYWRYAPHKSFK